jgi:hypothetical protein
MATHYANICSCCLATPLHAADGAEPIQLPLYLLGLDIQERWTFAVDIGPAKDLFLASSDFYPHLP